MNRKVGLNVPEEIKAALVFLVASVLSRGLTFITVPIFTRLMPVEEVGIVNLFSSWYTILGGVVSLGLTSGGLMFCFRKYENNKDQYLSSILMLTTVSSIVFASAFYVVQKQFGSLINLPKSLIVLMFIAFVFVPAQDFWIAKCRYENKYKLSGLVIILGSIMSSVVAVIAVIKLPTSGVLGYAEARLFGGYSVTVGIAVLIWIFTFIKGKSFCNVEYWRYSLTLSIPLIGQMLATQVLGFADRIMIDNYCGEAAVGIYSTIYTIGTITAMIWTAVNGTFTPYIYKNIDSNKEAVKKNSFLLLVMFSLISIIVVLAGPELTRLFGTDEYYEGSYIIPPVAAGVYLIAVCDLYSDLLVYLEKTLFIMYSTVSAAVFNIILNSVFIPKYGYIAAAFTTLFSYVLMAGVLYIFSMKICKNKGIRVSDVYSNRKIGLLVIITLSVDVILMVTYTKPIIRCIIALLLVILIIVFAKRFGIKDKIKVLLEKN